MRQQPTQIIADGSNYKSYISRWKASCGKAKIPFHATGEKGFYRLY
jgi:competence protein ComEC